MQRIPPSAQMREGVTRVLQAGFAGHPLRQFDDVIFPRIVVVEYHDILGPDRACMVPYRDDFCAREYPTPHRMLGYAGAGKRKGYRLVGCNAYGYNAFFIKRGIGENVLPEIPVADCFNRPRVIWGMNERFPAVKDLPWVDV